jgi:hypothetical protein
VHPLAALGYGGLEDGLEVAQLLQGLGVSLGATADQGADETTGGGADLGRLVPAGRLTRGGHLVPQAAS